MFEREEVPPPWVEHPEYGPGDTFWRQSGEAYFQSVWSPYYESLSNADQEAYLLRWQVPGEWRKFYFDNGWQDWLESTDD